MRSCYIFLLTTCELCSNGYLISTGKLKHFPSFHLFTHTHTNSIPFKYVTMLCFLKYSLLTLPVAFHPMYLSVCSDSHRLRCRAGYLFTKSNLEMCRTGEASNFLCCKYIVVSYLSSQFTLNLYLQTIIYCDLYRIEVD